MDGENPRGHQVKAPSRARAGNGATVTAVIGTECAQFAQIQVEPRTMFALSQGKTVGLGVFYLPQPMLWFFCLKLLTI